MKCASFDRIVTVFEKNALAVQEAKNEGKKVVGQYCLYSPSEIAVAAGAIPVSLCGTRNDSIPAAEEQLPRALCPLIKSSFGFALKDSCPLSQRGRCGGSRHHLRRQKDVRAALCLQACILAATAASAER